MIRYPILSDRFRIADRWLEHLLRRRPSRWSFRRYFAATALTFWHPSPRASVTPTVAQKATSPDAHYRLGSAESCPALR